jgi:hypothetical protein
MPDIHIKRGYRDMHVITACSEVGKRWLLDNIKAIPVEKTGELQIPIASEHVKDLEIAIKEDGIDVDVD